LLRLSHLHEEKEKQQMTTVTGNNSAPARKRILDVDAAAST